MKTVILNASPNKEGNTKKALNELLKLIENKSNESFDLIDLNIKHCMGCLNCSKTGECLFKDDMEKIYESVDQSDLLIFTSPVYFNSVTSVGKQVIDRFQRTYARRFILKNSPKVESHKKGILLATAGSKERHHEFDGLRMPIDLMFKANGIRDYKIILLEDFDKNKPEEIEKVIEKLYT